MAITRPKLIRNVVLLSQSQEDRIQEILNDGLDISKSSVIRKAIVFYHDYLYKKGEFNEAE
jgi:hypothetical protein